MSTHQPWKVTWTGPKRIPRRGQRRDRQAVVVCEQVATFTDRAEAEQFAIEHGVAEIVHTDRFGNWPTPYPVNRAEASR